MKLKLSFLTAFLINKCWDYALRDGSPFDLLLSATYDDLFVHTSHLPDHLETTRSLRLLAVIVVLITQSQLDFSSLENTSLSDWGWQRSTDMLRWMCVVELGRWSPSSSSSSSAAWFWQTLKFITLLLFWVGERNFHDTIAQEQRCNSVVESGTHAKDVLLFTLFM